MTRILPVSLGVLFAIIASSYASQDKKMPTLLERVAQWQYPGSKMNGATMSDVPTLNSKGERTVSSIQCKTVLTTDEPIAKVVQFYENKLKPVVDENPEKIGEEPKADSSRSVNYHSDLENRPLAIHIFTVIDEDSTTTLVISRAEKETRTHIAWTQYTRF